MTTSETTAGAAARSPGTQPLLLAFGFLIIIAMSAASLWLADRSGEDAEAVVETMEMQSRLSLILLDLRRAESAQRGYVITGQTPYLNDYRTAAARTLPAIEAAEAAVGADPDLKSALSKISPLVHQKLAELERVVQLYDKGLPDQARRMIQGGEGRDVMELIRQAIDGMSDAQREKLELRRSEARLTNLVLLAVTLLGSVLIVAIGALSVYLVQRNARQRDRAQKALELTNENLETMIAERTADLREANEEIQRFAYIVSHDLRSPLVNVMGFTAEIDTIKKDIAERLQELRGSDVEATQKDVDLFRDLDESLGFIKGSIGKMDRLINSILKLSREGRREFKLEYVSMDELMQSIAGGVAHRAAEKGATLEIGSLPPIKGDRLALEQIFSNLTDNALKYTRPGRAGVIRIRGRTDHAMAIYEVEDNGRGIAPQDQQRIFELFRRAGEQDQAGEGIGLAHVRALVRRMGGYITVKSELGEGTTFTVTLPRAPLDIERPAA